MPGVSGGSSSSDGNFTTSAPANPLVPGPYPKVAPVVHLLKVDGKLLVRVFTEKNLSQGTSH
jgi:hypothetical protein